MYKRYSIIFLLLYVFAGIAEASETSTSLAEPLKLIPNTGSFEGGQLAFIDVKEPVSERGKASIVCQFSLETPIIGYFDSRSHQYICRVPTHLRPEPVPVKITVNGKVFNMRQPYVYTTHGKYDSPVTQVHVERLQQRSKWVREQIPKSVKLCAVLKNGNPVGWLGKVMEETGKVDYFCVPRMQDGIALRKAGVEVPIMVMYLTHADYVPLLLHYNLEPSAYSLSWVERANQLLQATDTDSQLKVHLWIDTGISREGVMPNKALPLARAIDKSKYLHLQGIATHFCCLDDKDMVEIKKNNRKNKTALQKHRFDRILNKIHGEGIGRNAIIHASSSDGLRYGLTPVYYDMLRVGSLLFENPLPKQRNYHWTTKITQIKTLPKGWCVNYGCDEQIDEDTKVGIVSHIPDDEVNYYIRGKKVEKLLDHEVIVVLDLSTLPEVKEGEEVTMVFSGDDSPLDTSYSAPVTLHSTTRKTTEY